MAEVEVDRCEVVSSGGTLRTGESRRLAAVARTEDGRVVTGVTFIWTSSHPDRVRVAGDGAIGGEQPGLARVTASVGAKVCSGAVDFVLLADAAVDVRVTVISDRGVPLDDASVTLAADGRVVRAGGSMTAFSAVGAVAHVTASAPGHSTVTVFDPPSRDVVLTLAPLPAEGASRGYLGAVEPPPGDHDDGLAFGIAGGPLDADFGRLGMDRVFCEAQLIRGIARTPSGPPGDAMVSGALMVGSEPLRCGAQNPAPTQIGCFVARTTEGPTALWSIAGRLSLAGYSRLSGRLSAGQRSGDEPFACDGIMTAWVASITSEFGHGAALMPQPDLHPDAGGAPTYGAFDRADLAAARPLELRSVLAVPELPDLGEGCAQNVLALVAIAVPGHGLVPLGFGFGEPAARDDGMRECTVDEVPLNAALADVALQQPGARLVLIAMAFERFAGDAPSPLSFLIHHPDRIAEEQVLAGPFPRPGSAQVDLRTREVRAAPTGGATRVEFAARGARWQVYAPPSRTSFTLPDIETPALDGEVTIERLVLGANGYDHLWERRVGEMTTNVVGYTITECRAGDRACRLTR